MNNPQSPCVCIYCGHDKVFPDDVELYYLSESRYDSQIIALSRNISRLQPKASRNLRSGNDFPEESNGERLQISMVTNNVPFVT